MSSALRERGAYIGDYQQLVAVGDTFYGGFSASNDVDEDNGQGEFPSGARFQRYVRVRGEIRQDVSVTKKKMGVLVTALGQPVGVSIDPYFLTAAALRPRD